MESAFATIALFIFGAMLGSFACCQVWRIRRHDKSKWSHCMNCKYQLQWYDNIPIVSWLSLGGKCRKCHKKIGYAEILTEFGLAALYALSFWLWPAYDALMALEAIEVTKFVLFLVILTFFTILFIYDAKWKELPVGIMLGVIGVATVFFGLNVYQNYMLNGEYDWMSFVGSLIFLPGLYFLMYKVSGETWVGGGDWILCVALALILGDVWLSLFCLFSANIIGCLVSFPLMATMEKGKKGKISIPFGPYLITACVLIYFMQNLVFKLVVF